MRKLDPKLREKVKALFLAGESAQNIATKTGISTATVYDWLNRDGVKPRKSLEEHKEERMALQLQARELYDSGSSTMDIAKHLHRTKKTIIEWLGDESKNAAPIRLSDDERKLVASLWETCMSKTDIAIRLGRNRNSVSKVLGRGQRGRNKNRYRGMIDEANRLFKSGLTKRDVAKQLGLDYHTVSGWIGIGVITPEQVKRMDELRAGGMSYAAIGRETGCSGTTVWRWLNPEVNAARREYAAEYNARTEVKAARRQYDAKYNARPKRKAAMRKYLDEYNSRPEVKARKREYIAERLKNDVQFRLSFRLRARLRIAVRRGAKSGSAVRDLGCTIAELKARLEAQFKPGMTWENWTRDGWHIDHIVPLAAFDLTDREQLKRACHYTNLRPLWCAENCSKGARVLEGAGNVTSGGIRQA